MPVSLRRLAIVFAALAALVAGLVTALVPTEPAQAATADVAVLRAPASLTGGHELVSPNGNFTLLMGRNGDLLLYDVWHEVLWSSRTAGHHGAHLSLQANGNLVIRARSGRALWATKTRGRHAMLAMRSDGRLMLQSGRHKLWSTPTLVRYGSHDNPIPASRLLSPEALQAGQQLVSRNRDYRAAMGADGNFSVAGPGGIVWQTNSSGWTGAELVLAGNGNLILYAADGSALWQSRTRAAGGMLVLADNGNLVLFDRHGTIVWQSRKAAEPQIAPTATTSHYIRDITGAATDAATMSALGKADAVASGPAKRLVVLDIGAQFSDLGTGTQWGVQLTGGNGAKLADAQLVTALEGYLSGYGANLPSGAEATIAVVTNNDSHQYYVSGSSGCPEPPTGTDDPLGAAGGTEWANVVNQLATYAQSWPGLTVAGGNDIEANFAGCVDQATAWTRALLGATSQPYVFTGTAWGCPTTLGQTSADCNAHGDYGWTQQALYQLAYGLAPSQSVPLPQIYIGAQATQWADISATGSTPIAFGGVLTSVAACAPAGSGCTSLSPGTAWNTLSDQLTRSTGVRTGAGLYATDLRVN